MKIKIFLEENQIESLSKFLDSPDQHEINFSLSRENERQCEVLLNYDEYVSLKDNLQTFEKQIGILMIKDENDILEEYLNKVAPFFDPILVLDGSEDDEARDICSKFPEVKYFEKDCNVLKSHARNSARGHLLEKAREIASHKSWVAILHADEFPCGDLLEMFNYVEKSFPHVDSIIIRNIDFFPHVSQKETWKFEKGDLIEPLMQWCLTPGWPEYRFFRLKDEFAYTEGDDLHVIPRKAVVKYALLETGFFFKHISFRTKEQMKKRVKTRIESGWQPLYQRYENEEDIFFETISYPEGSENTVLNPRYHDGYKIEKMF